jgi:PAS domain S-box-containing protein
LPQKYAAQFETLQNTVDLCHKAMVSGNSYSTPEKLAEIAALRQRVAELEHQLEAAHHLQLTKEQDYQALLVLFDSLEDGLVLLDANNHVLAINQAMAHLFGGTSAALLGQDWETICHAHGFDMLSSLTRRALADSCAHSSREHYLDTSGQSRILDIQALPLATGKQVLLRMVDSTERLHIEAMRIQNERQAATGKLSATIAHEVNTPLQAIQSALYMAERSHNQQRNRYLRAANLQINRISAILQRLLDLHQVDDVPLTAVNMNALIKQLLDALQTTLEEKQIDVHCQFDSQLPSLWIKRDELTQVLLNLVVNAIEAMDKSGTLRIATRFVRYKTESDVPQSEQAYINYARIDIEDNGTGMNASTQTRIFDPFFTTRRGRTGVGLAISRKIIHEHGGAISVHSTPHAGSTFTLVLPLEPHMLANEQEGV